MEGVEKKMKGQRIEGWLGRKRGRREGEKEGRREGGMEEGREGRREEGTEGWRKGGRYLVF
jgi:hypothetical protein